MMIMVMKSIAFNSFTKGLKYDFPLTDTSYINELRSRTKNCGERNTGDLYLTLSLGVNHYDWHYKLVAGVIDLAS